MSKINGETGENPQGENNGGKKLPPPEWGAKTRFGVGQPQPSNEAKKKGWAKKKRNQQLMRLILQRTYVGKIKQANGVVVDGGFRKQLKEYFGLSEEELEDTTNEAAIMLRMIAEATSNGNVQAAQAILERAYGRPKDFLDLGDDEGQRPQINITVMAAAPGTPDISEAEDIKLLYNEGSESETDR